MVKNWSQDIIRVISRFQKCFRVRFYVVPILLTDSKALEFLHKDLELHDWAEGNVIGMPEETEKKERKKDEL